MSTRYDASRSLSVLRGGVPPTASDELEHPARLAVEVIVLWRGDVLTISHRSPPGTWFVGGPASCADISLPVEMTGSESLCVAVGSRSEVFAVLTARGLAWCTLPDGSKRDFPQRDVPGHLSAPTANERLLPLGLGHRAHLCFGEIEIQVAAVPAGRPPSSRLSIGFDGSTISYFGLCSLVVAGLLSVLSLMAPPLGLSQDEQTTSQRFALLQTYLEASAERERDEARPPVKPTQASAGDRPVFSPQQAERLPVGTERESDPSAAYPASTSGFESSVPNARDARERLLQIDEARRFSTISFLTENLAALSDPQLHFRRELSGAEAAEMQRLFNPDNNPLLDDYGPVGLALSGTGIRGGGKADVIPLEEVGTIGSARGKGLERSAHFGSPTGSYRPQALQLRVSTSVTLDATAPESIRRAINAQSARIRACYNQGSASNPDLSSAVVVRLVVHPDGQVDQVSTEATTLPVDVRTCIAYVFQGLRFPSAGSTVDAAYTVRWAP